MFNYSISPSKVPLNYRFLCCLLKKVDENISILSSLSISWVAQLVALSSTTQEAAKKNKDKISNFQEPFLEKNKWEKNSTAKKLQRTRKDCCSFLCFSAEKKIKINKSKHRFIPHITYHIFVSQKWHCKLILGILLLGGF